MEFGDFQTPDALALRICRQLLRSGFEAAAIVEPSCGNGAFLSAARTVFPSAALHAFDCNPAHVRKARARLDPARQASVRCGDFFQLDWDARLASLPEPLLVLGNPPWVTNSALGSLGSGNLPEKRNLDGLRGIDALTGRANFDISEWMLRENLRWLSGRRGAIAVLCKTSVARKVLAAAWKAKLSIESASIRRIEADLEFGVAVEACLLQVQVVPGSHSRDCSVYDDLDTTRISQRFGLRNGRLVSALDAPEAQSALLGKDLRGWRSGLKHDCSRVFEFERREDRWVNGFGEAVSIEDAVLYPLLKSSDLAQGRLPRKSVLVPQVSMDRSPEELKQRAPLAWSYLGAHAVRLGARASSIYAKRPPFSIFGIGPYAFTPWKLAVSGLYKRFTFTRVGPIEGRPVMLDDTCYFFPCESQVECEQLYALLKSGAATEFLNASIFWDAKRPITARVLNSLDLGALARACGSWNSSSQRLAERQAAPGQRDASRLRTRSPRARAAVKPGDSMPMQSTKPGSPA